MRNVWIGRFIKVAGKFINKKPLKFNMAKREIVIPEGGCPYRAVCQFYDLPVKVNFGEDAWQHIKMLKPEYMKEMDLMVK